LEETFNGCTVTTSIHSLGHVAGGEPSAVAALDPWLRELEGFGEPDDPAGLTVTERSMAESWFRGEMC